MRRNPHLSKPGNWVLQKVAMLAILLPIVWFSLPLATGMTASLLEFVPLLGRPTDSSITLNLVAGEKPIVPIPDFMDAYQTQRILEAVSISATEKMPVKVSQVK